MLLSLTFFAPITKFGLRMSLRHYVNQSKCNQYIKKCFFYTVNLLKVFQLFEWREEIRKSNFLFYLDRRSHYMHGFPHLAQDKASHHWKVLDYHNDDFWIVYHPHKSCYILSSRSISTSHHPLDKYKNKKKKKKKKKTQVALTSGWEFVWLYCCSVSRESGSIKLWCEVYMK